MLAPSHEINQIWFEHVVMPQSYAQMCQKVNNGSIIAYNPRAQYSDEFQHRFDFTKQLYERIFGAQPKWSDSPSVVTDHAPHAQTPPGTRDTPNASPNHESLNEHHIHHSPPRETRDTPNISPLHEASNLSPERQSSTSTNTKTPNSTYHTPSTRRSSGKIADRLKSARKSPFKQSRYDDRIVVTMISPCGSLKPIFVKCTKRALFEKLQAAWANSRGTDSTKLSFVNSENEELDPGLRLSELGIEHKDTIMVKPKPYHADVPESEEESSDSESIVIRVRFEDRKNDFKISMVGTVEDLTASVTKAFEIDETNLVVLYLFDEIVSPERSMAEIGAIDGDVFYARIQSC